MNKKSALISWIKNKIFSIISRLKEKNTEPGVTEEKEQPVDSEPISRSENKTETRLNENKEQLFGLKKELGESIDAILNKLFEGISGLLEAEYKDRLIGLERSIEELKKKEKEKVVSDLKTYKEELDEVRNLAKTAKLSSEGNTEKIETIMTGKFKTKKSKENIEKTKRLGLSNIPDYDKLTTISHLINQVSNDEIDNTTNKIKKMRDMKIDASDEELKRVQLFIDTISLSSEEDKEASNVDRSIVVADFLNELKESVNEISIQLLHNEGVILLKTKAFMSAYKCFYKITKINPDLKGAYLNSGFALGKLGDIDGEIKCYDKALSKDQKYEKALLNKEIAKKEKKWKPWK
jgi:tetratricopeptide (TPR) repeat protein